MAKILCIDDNETNRFMIGKVLGRAGFTLCFAADGESGVAAAKAERPDLILMDIQMPGIDGFEATRQIKADRETDRIPVVALSAHEVSDKSEEIAACGCDGFMTKPLDFKKLIELAHTLTSAPSNAAKASGRGR
jgi:CheY-like chemotaxis protein